jgi:hypothetical protein
MRLNAGWTNDCQGKKDYDGDILSISTRYWPRGGGFSVVNHSPEGTTIQDNDSRPEIRPSACCKLIIWNGDDSIVLAKQNFESETFDEIKSGVELWASIQMEKAVSVLQREFNGKT